MARSRKSAEDQPTSSSALPVYRVAIGGEVGAAANACAIGEDITLTELVKTALKYYLKNVSDPPYWPRRAKDQ